MGLRELHGIAMRLHRIEWEESVELTDRQAWLFDAVISELQYRARRAHPLRRCTCWLCMADGLRLEPDEPP